MYSKEIDYVGVFIVFVLGLIPIALFLYSYLDHVEKKKNHPKV
jgi:hypothetical protein